MKIKLFNIIILFLPIILFGQMGDYRLDTSYSVIVYNGDTLNGYFSDYNIKNIKFKQFEKKIFSRLNKKVPRKVNQTTFKRENFEYLEKKLEGEFKDGKRHGEWIYWIGDYSPNSSCNSSWSYQTINYERDRIKLRSFGNGIDKMVIFNSDSTLVEGKIKLFNEYELELYCKNNQCVFLNDSIELTKCSFSNWEKKLEDIVFDYEIKMITKRRKN